MVGLIGSVWLWVAFAAWALVFVAMMRHLWQTVFIPARAR